VQRYFGQHRTKSQLDRGTADEIRQLLLRTRRAAVMHGFVAAVRRDYAVSYERGYAPVSTVALARKIWNIRPTHKACDLRPGFYQYPTAVEHGCAQLNGPVVDGEPPCPIVDPPHATNGFSSEQENDGFAEYAEGNAGTCMGDPRGAEIQVTAQPKPITVSYLPGGGTATYRDPLLGFTLRYPRRLHVQQVAYGSLTSVEGVEVANYVIDPTLGPNQPLPPRAVELLFTEAGGRSPGPGSATGARFPIKITDADLASGVYTTQGAADGLSFSLTIRTGVAPSRRDVAALRAIVASIHFPPLRIRHFTPTHLYVLGRASAYPLGSVTEVQAGLPLPYYRERRSGRFYLEHTTDGFWTITWPDDLLHGYKACGPHWDVKRRLFTCPTGALWDIEGRVVKNPDPARDQDDPLRRTQAAEADGDVLVSLPPQG
jgi:hypothetical protein